MIVGAGFKPAHNRNHDQTENTFRRISQTAFPNIKMLFSVRFIFSPEEQ